MSECMDTGIWGAPLPHLSKARRVQNTKGTTEMNMKTRIGTGTWQQELQTQRPVGARQTVSEMETQEYVSQEEVAKSVENPKT